MKKYGEPSRKEVPWSVCAKFQNELVGIPPFTHQDQPAELTERKKEGSNRRLLRDMPFRGEPLPRLNRVRFNLILPKESIP